MRRELIEEMGVDIKAVKYLGSINPMTAMYAAQKANEVFAAEIEKSEAKLKNNHLTEEAIKEMINKSEFVPIEEIYGMIRNNKIYCGLTQASLLKFAVFFNLL